ncbi:unknown protein [Chroococcus sp. FPU101]|nr:unknown protein [Chroococcus sp. FPU101]
MILGVLLPSLWRYSADSKPINEQRNVGVIELNPIEQSRLPNLSPVPEVPSVPSLPNLPSLNSSSIPDLSSLNPVNPPVASVPSLPSLPSLPPLPPISSGSYAPPSIGVYSPPTPSIRIPRTAPNFPPPPTYLPAPPNTNTPNLEVAKPRPITRPQFDPFRDSLDLENLRRAPINASQEEQLRNQQEQEVQQQNTEISTLPDQVALNAERRRRLINDILERSASVQPDSSNTTDEQARKNYIAWLNKVQEVKPEAVYVTGIYPRAACSANIEGTSVYGVSVNPQGIMTGTPYLIKSAGYPLLNQTAFQTVRGMSLSNTTGQPKSYRVSVSYKFDPSICPGYTQPQPLEQNPPIETRVNPAQTPTLEAPKPSVTPKDQNSTPIPVSPPQTPVNSTPENVRVAPPSSPQPEATPQTPANPSEDNLINTPSANPKPENLIPQTPINPPVETKKPEQQPVIQPPETPAQNQQSVEPPAPPTLKKPEIEPPSPPTSKKPEPPSEESRNLDN